MVISLSIMPKLAADASSTVRPIWLTSLINPKFTESLYYNVVQYGGTSAARWGGDISGQTWCFPNGAYQSYDFSYDKLNRLISAAYTDSDDNDDAFSTEYSYDKHGNLTAITCYNQMKNVVM